MLLQYVYESIQISSNIPSSRAELDLLYWFTCRDFVQNRKSKRLAKQEQVVVPKEPSKYTAEQVYSVQELCKILICRCIVSHMIWVRLFVLETYGEFLHMMCTDISNVVVYTCLFIVFYVPRVDVQGAMIVRRHTWTGVRTMARWLLVTALFSRGVWR